MGLVRIAFLLTHEIVHIGAPEGSIVSPAVYIDQLKGLASPGSQLPELLQPGMELAHKGVIVAFAGHLLIDPLYLSELLQKSVVLSLCPVSFHTEGLCLPGFLTAVARLGVAGVNGKCTVGAVRIIACQPGKSSLPVGLGVVFLDIPGIVGHAVEGQLGGLSMLHGIAYKSAHITGCQPIV